jgi:hypothetical protein
METTGQYTEMPLNPNERRRITRDYHSELASWLTTRGDLLHLAGIDPELSTEALAGIIGREAFEENPNRYGDTTAAEFLRKATIQLDGTRDPGEVLQLTQRQRAAIVDAFGTVEMRRSAK